MVGRGYSTNICKPLNISIGTVMRNLEMLKFVPDHIKAKCVSMQLKKSFLIRYISDQ